MSNNINRLYLRQVGEQRGCLGFHFWLSHLLESLTLSVIIFLLPLLCTVGLIWLLAGVNVERCLEHHLHIVNAQ